MQVEISNTGNDLLHVYKVRTNTPCKNTEFRPICSIWEDDFFDLISEADFIKATEKGKIRFNVNEIELRDKAKTIFN